jgi:hypothetical protein
VAQDGLGVFMKIEDLPRPWLLAAMTGVPMSVLLERAERERAGRLKEARQDAPCEEFRRRRASSVERPATHRPVGPIKSRSLAY